MVWLQLVAVSKAQRNSLVTRQWALGAMHLSTVERHLFMLLGLNGLKPAVSASLICKAANKRCRVCCKDLGICNMTLQQLRNYCDSPEIRFHARECPNAKIAVNSKFARDCSELCIVLLTLEKIMFAE